MKVSGYIPKIKGESIFWSLSYRKRYLMKSEQTNEKKTYEQVYKIVQQEIWDVAE